MKTNSELPWIEAGYFLFAKEGPNGLKVEALARQVGISKSSFYHLFADMVVFQEKLLQYHIERAKKMSTLALESKNIVPDLLQLLVNHKQELLFNRQLCINRENQIFQSYFEKAFAIVEISFFDKWVNVLELKEQPHIARNILKIYADNFFLRITAENLNYEWLLKLLNEIKILVNDFKQ